MKLAEALLIRADYQKKLENINMRILNNIKVQENDKPHEDPNKLIKESLKINDEMTNLICKINETNHNTKFNEDMNLAQALVKRDSLIKKRRTLDNIVGYAHEPDYRLTHTEIKMNFSINIEDLQKEIDNLSKEFRLLDVKIQEINWTTDLI